MTLQYAVMSSFIDSISLMNLNYVFETLHIL